MFYSVGKLLDFAAEVRKRNHNCKQISLMFIFGFVLAPFICCHYEMGLC